MANPGREYHTTIDVNALTYESTSKLVSAKLEMSPKCCIFKIPVILKRHSIKAYTPNAFSIGPWHFGEMPLRPTQKIKLKYLQGLIKRQSDPDGEELLKKLENAMKEVEEEAREYYAGPVEIQDFYKVLLLDGCFIIELFRKYAQIVRKDEDDPVFNMSCMLQFLRHDLILLENQIPWFVLGILFDMTKNHESESMSLDELALSFFGNIFTTKRPPFEELKKTKFGNHNSRHILDLLRNSLILPRKNDEQEQVADSRGGSNRNQESSREGTSNLTLGFGEIDSEKKGVPDEYAEREGWQTLHTATSLKEAGIKFRKNSESMSILDIKFHNGTFEIPSLLVQETTETIFRNLISFEQCIPKCPPEITSYARIMDNLIDTTKDMEIFCKEKIINNWLNPDESTGFFNELYNDAYMKEFHYQELCQQVVEYCQARWPRWRANLLHNYFSTPWSITGVIVAGLILIMTVIGAVCSIIQAKPADT